ncbi:MAG: hypothetical protein JO022_08705 [Acidobacteriaceae bacterium]|nr:hypothetical protein [Acidobacteriaceae bacterium]
MRWIGFLLLLTQVSNCLAITRPDDSFLDDVEHRSFLYFWEQADSATGLIRDRARNDGRSSLGVSSDIASIAATGFGLTGICIAAERHWITQEQARERIRLTLHFLAERAVSSHGFYYHWMTTSTGERRWGSEFSSIDTALLMGGILTVRQRYANDREIMQLADFIYTRVDFTWMLNGDSLLLSHGWRPETGFIVYRWDSYSELMLLYLLGIGSPTHPIPPDSWYAWARPKMDYHGYSYVGEAPLFTYQYSQAWVDFRNRKDAPPSDLDYFENSIMATRAHQAFCMRLQNRFPLSFGPECCWGITASDSPNGYMIWGGPPPNSHLDGTVVPCAPGGSLMFAPDICIPALKAMIARYGEKIYGHYGFADAFNPTTGWFDPEVVGIDAGITMLSAENLRGGTVWRWFMKNPSITQAMRLAKFRPTR